MFIPQPRYREYDEVIDLRFWTKNEKAMTYALRGCSSAKEVILPTSYSKYSSTSAEAEIFEGFFYDCSSLKSVVVPDCFISIGKNAFYGCTSLEVVKILNNNINVSAVSASSFPGSTAIHIFNTDYSR